MVGEETLRAAALQIMDRFNKDFGIEGQEYAEELVGDDVRFFGDTPDGKRFWCGYVKPRPI